MVRELQEKEDVEETADEKVREAGGKLRVTITSALLAFGYAG